MRKLIVLTVVLVQSTGCAGLVGESMFSGDEEGRFLLSTDRAGMEAFSDALSGLVTTGKSAPNMADSYWQTRETAIKTRAFKVIKGGKEYNVGGGK